MSASIGAIFDIKNLPSQDASNFTARVENSLSLDQDSSHAIRMILLSYTTKGSAPAQNDAKRLVLETNIVQPSRVVDTNSSILYISDLPVAGPSSTVTRAISTTEWPLIPLVPGVSTIDSITFQARSSIDGTLLSDSIEQISITYEIVRLSDNKAVQRF